MVRTVGRSAPIAGALSNEEFARLLRLRDPLGVLSVFADARAGEGVRHGPRAGEITVRGSSRARASLRREARERWAPCATGSMASPASSTGSVTPAPPVAATPSSRG